MEKLVPPRPGRGASSARLAEILRVDHAGELAAVQIYRGQKAVLGATPGHGRIAGQMAEMEAQEAAHLARFDSLLTEHQVRPTVMAPVWRLAGFALGAATALLGEKAAHACTTSRTVASRIRGGTLMSGPRASVVERSIRVSPC